MLTQSLDCHFVPAFDSTMYGLRFHRTLTTFLRSVEQTDVSIIGDKANVMLWGGDPFLVQLEGRQWGPLSNLTLDKIPELDTKSIHHVSVVDKNVSAYTERVLPHRLCILRQPFTPQHRSLTDILWCPMQRIKRCCVPAKIFHSKNFSCVVDLYQLTGDFTFSLRRSSVNLLSFLRAEGFTIDFLPDHLFEERTLESSDAVHQTAEAVVMVAPNGFHYNASAAEDNKFMSSELRSYQEEAHTITERALKQYHALHQCMTANGQVKVHLFGNDPLWNTPDAVFPNNWFSTHKEASGDPYKLVPNRRKERRSDIADLATKSSNGSVLDLTRHEEKGRFLEGTGSLVLDRQNRVAYVSRSERSDQSLAEIWTKEMKYLDLVCFDSVDKVGRPIYHTNVLLSVGTHFAVVCLQALPDPKQQNSLLDRLSQHRTVVLINREQMNAMCGNILEIKDTNGWPVLCMSTRAYNAFSPEQIDILSQHVARIIHSPIDVIETIGGGGVRCTIAELF